MKPRDFLWLGMLLIAVALIWLRDRAWVPVAPETLPVLVALPFFVWLGAPWQLRAGRFRLHQPTLALAGLLLGLGGALDSTLLLAGAWTLALWSWLRNRVHAERAELSKLTLLPLMAFPWLTLDFAPLGWWFRVSAAWTAEHLFGALGFAVLRQGTNLLVQGLPIEVAPACSGMNALQTILIVGVAFAWLELRGSRWFWLALAPLPALAWTANALRICATVTVAVSWGDGLARGWFHEVGGWLVVTAVILFWWAVLGAGSRRLGVRPACA